MSLIGLLALLPFHLFAQYPAEVQDDMSAGTPLISLADVETWVSEKIVPEIDVQFATAASVAVVLDGEVLYASNLGAFDPVKSIAVEPHHQFMIGSISKTLNGLAVAKLLEAGVIASIDDPVNRYMKRFKLPGEWGAEVTVSQLLTHTAGLESPGFGSSAGDQTEIPATADYIGTHLPKIVRPPGDGLVYANYGPPMIGVMVEDITGKRYDEFLHEEILQPLGIHDSRFEYDPTGGPTLVRAGITKPDTPDAAISYAPITVNTPFAAPAGSLQTTAADMARYMNALLGHSPEVVTPAMIETTQQDLYTNFNGLNSTGLGIIHGHWNEFDTWGHGGLIAGFRSSMLLVPEKSLGVYVSFAGGTSPFFGKGGNPGETVELFLADVLGPVVPKPAIEPVTRIEDVAGRYWMELRAHTTAETIMALRRVWTVTGSEDGEILLNGKPHDEIAPGLFQERRDDGRPPYLQALDGNRFMVRLSYATRVSGMNDPGNIERLAMICLVVIISGIFSVFVGGRGRFTAPMAALSAGAIIYVLVWPMLEGTKIDLELFAGNDWRFRWTGILTWLAVLPGALTLVGGSRDIATSGAGVIYRIGQVHRIIIGLAALGLAYAMNFANII